MKIAIAGTGYVGLSLATLLSEKHEVVALDIIPEKVDMINNRISTIQDKYIEEFMLQAKKGEREMNLKATLDYKEAFNGAKFVIISTPTTGVKMIPNEHKHYINESIFLHRKPMGLICFYVNSYWKYVI